jgi:hypothetical protein
MEPVTFNRQTTQPPGYLAGRRFVPLGSSGSDAPTLTKPIRRYSFVRIYFKKSTRYHLSTNYETTHQSLDRSSRRIIVCNFFLKSTRFSHSPSQKRTQPSILHPSFFFPSFLLSSAFSVSDFLFTIPHSLFTTLSSSDLRPLTILH